VSEVHPPFPIWRAVLAVALSLIVALALMPALTLAPPLLFWGGPIGPFFALIVAPAIGLIAGPFLAPLTFFLALALQSAMIFIFTRHGHGSGAARSLWAWALAGLATGALAGTMLGLEMNIFGFGLPRTSYSGAATGLVCALVARAVMTFRTSTGRPISNPL